MTSAAVSQTASGGAALTIAIVGLALAVASLAWQAATFLLTGPRIRVELQWGSMGPNGVLIAPVSVAMPQMDEALAGKTEKVLAVRVTNVGRMPGSIDHIQVVFENGMRFFDPQFFPNKPLPHRLESHASETWLAPMKVLEWMVATNQKKSATDWQSQQRARFWVEPAYGRSKTTRESIIIKAGQAPV